MHLKQLPHIKLFFVLSAHFTMMKIWFVLAIFCSVYVAAFETKDEYQRIGCITCPKKYTGFNPFNPFGKLYEKLDKIIKLIESKNCSNQGKISTYSIFRYIFCQLKLQLIGTCEQDLTGANGTRADEQSGLARGLGHHFLSPGLSLFAQQDQTFSGFSFLPTPPPFILVQSGFNSLVTLIHHDASCH